MNETKEETQTLKDALVKMECEELEQKLSEHFHSMLLDKAGHDVRHEAGEHRTGVQRQLGSSCCGKKALQRCVKHFLNHRNRSFGGRALPDTPSRVTQGRYLGAPRR